jgi:hypothetical protein
MDLNTAGAPKALAKRDERLTCALMDHAVGCRGLRWAEKAFREYLSPLEAGAEHLSLFLAWALYHWRAGEGRTVNESFLAKHGASLSLADRAWLRSQAAARISFWEVREVIPAVGLRVRDLLGDETRFIHMDQGPWWFPERSTWLGRVVEHAGVSLYRGLHAGCLGPPVVDVLVRATLEALRGASGREEREKRIIQTWAGYYTPAAGTQPC